MIQKKFKNLKQSLGFELLVSTGTQESLSLFLAARLGVLYVVLLVVVLQQVLGGNIPSGFSSIYGYALLAICFAFNLLQSSFLDRLPKQQLIAIINILFDSLIISSWIYLFGNEANLFALLYLVQILFVALIFHQKGAVVAAIITILSFGGVSLVLSYPNALLIWAIYSVLFVTLGLMGGYLSQELHVATESLKAKSRKIENLQKFHEKIMMNMPTGLLTVDSDMSVSFVNPAGEHILNKKAEEMVGRSLGEVEQGFEPFFANIEIEDIDEDSSLEGDEEKDSETTLSVTNTSTHRTFFAHPKSNKGSTRLQQIVEIGKGTKRRIIRGDVAELDTGSSLEYLLGKHLGARTRILLFQDVTKLVHLEEKLKQNEKLAAVGQLAAGIAHEIRNPLASMSASIEMLKTAFPEVEGNENQKLMEIAIKEIDRLNNLISEFLDFVKPFKFRFEKVCLDKLLGDLVSTVQRTKVYEKKVQIFEKYDENSIALANEEKLKQVIWNLLVNAVEAMEEPGTIEVGCSIVNKQTVRFWVQDEGQGMDEDVLTRLYEPFFTTKEKGTGLGLATAYKIVEAHHGEIRVSSEVDQGTRFEIILRSA